MPTASRRRFSSWPSPGTTCGSSSSISTARRHGKDEPKKLHEQLAEEAEKVYERHVKGLNEFVKENGDKIKAHFESLTRYEEGLKTDPRTMFQTQRRWDEMQDLRKEAKGWIADLDSRENALKADLLDLLQQGSEVRGGGRRRKADRAAKGGGRAKEGRQAEAEAPPNPAAKPRRSEGRQEDGRSREQAEDQHGGGRTAEAARRKTERARSHAEAHGRRCRFQPLGRRPCRQPAPSPPVRIP